MTITLVQNLLLTSKQKFRFGLARAGQVGQSGTCVLKSMGGFEQVYLSPCTCRVSHVPSGVGDPSPHAVLVQDDGEVLPEVVEADQEVGLLDLHRLSLDLLQDELAGHAAQQLVTLLQAQQHLSLRKDDIQIQTEVSILISLSLIF